MPVIQAPYQDSLEIAANLVEQDGTYDRKGNLLNLSKGYAVGGKVVGISVGKDDPHKNARVARWLDALPHNIAYLGSWTHEGVIYIDAVDVLTSYLDAYITSVERKELAFYDFGTHTTINTF